MSLNNWDACISLSNNVNIPFKIEVDNFYPSEPMKISLNESKINSFKCNFEKDLKYKIIDILNKIIYLNDSKLWNQRITMHKLLCDIKFQLENFILV
jgi:hypothetical protein